MTTPSTIFSKEPPVVIIGTRRSASMVETSFSNSSSKSSADDLAELLRRRNESERPFRSLKDLSTCRSWDHSWPTLTAPHRFTDRHSYVSDAPFLTVLKHHNQGVTYGLLKAVGAVETKANHIVLYGGSLVDIVLKREQSISDWDLRLIGPQFCGSEQACVVAAKKFVQDVFRWLAQESERINVANARTASASTNEPFEAPFDLSKVTTSRIRSTVTVRVPGRSSPRCSIQPTTLQLTFEPYATVRDLFCNSLPHCTRIALIDDEVVLDELAHYTLESVCVVVRSEDLLHASLSAKDDSDADAVRNGTEITAPSLAHELSRVIKYFHKGFDVILPDLDMTKIPRRLLKFDQTEVLDLPYLTIYYDKVDENKIMVSSLEVPEEVCDRNARDGGRGGYGSIHPNSINVGLSVHHNIKCLIAGELGRFQYVAEGERTDSVFDCCPLLTNRMVGKAYEMVECTLKRNLDVQTTLDYFGVGVNPSEVLSKLVMDPVQAKPKTFKVNHDVLADLLTCEKEALMELIQSLPEVMKEQGRDKLVHISRCTVSTELQVREALLGSYAKGRP